MVKCKAKLERVSQVLLIIVTGERASSEGNIWSISSLPEAG